MTQLVVSGLDAEVIARLSAKAKRHGHSLEQELRLILTSAARLEAAEKLALADRIRIKTPTTLASDSTDLLREDRDRR